MILCSPCAKCSAWPPQLDTTEQLDAWRRSHVCEPDLTPLRSELALMAPDPHAARHRRELAEALR